MGLPIQWLSHLPQDSEERDRFEKTVRNSTKVLARFREILSAKLEHIETYELNDDHFTKPAWAERQAFILGYKKAIKELDLLFSFMDKK